MLIAPISVREVGNANSANYTSIYDFGLNICMKTLREMMDLIEAAQQENLSEDGIESWAGNPSDRRHSGHESYMTPEYMLAHYKKRLAQIAAGKHKYPKEVAQLQAKIAKLEKQGVAEEQLEETTPEAIAKINELTRN